MLLGVALTVKGKNEQVYVEYHHCDKCGREYRVYLKTKSATVEEAFQALARMMGNKPEEQDLCFDCQNQVIGNQVMFPMEV
jgi:hypothetical protein